MFTVLLLHQQHEGLSKMKMLQRDYQTLKTMIADFYSADRYEAYLGNGHSNKRYICDAKWLSPMSSEVTRFVCDHLYKYLNDDHIYTALKRMASSKHTLDIRHATARG